MMNVKNYRFVSRTKYEDYLIFSLIFKRKFAYPIFKIFKLK